MFKKKPNIKTLSPLRSSDRRKTADRIIADFGLGQPEVDSNDAEAKAAATSAHSDLRKSLLPENSLSAKFMTTSGPSLREVSGTVYVGSHGAGEQRILWVKIEDTLYPSVYTLWHNPRILPLLHTPSFVVGKLKNGAELMTPGLAGPPFPQKAKKGAIVAVASLENPSVPVAVGTCSIDISALETTRGAKGHAVETFHWAGDDLWDWSTSGRSGVAPPEEIPDWLADLDSELAQATENTTLEDGDEPDGSVSLGPSETPSKAPPARNGYVSGEDAIFEVVDGPGCGGMTTTEIDDTFWRAFLYGAHTFSEPSKRSTLNFPLTQSFVMSHLVLPFLPSFTPEQTTALQIKKTSWKNARKFIKALDKGKVLLSKETKSEATVLDIDFSDRSIKEFTPYRLSKRESTGGTASNTPGSAAHVAGAASADESIGQTLKVQSLYRPPASLSPLLPSTAQPYYTLQELRNAVFAYIDVNNLASNLNRRLVTLDPLIANAVLTQPDDATALAAGTIPRDALADRVVKASAAFHLILRNGETLASLKTKPKAGPPPKVSVVLETRSGNKTATRVHGLEEFGVAPGPLAEELRRACASSTSVEPFKAGKGLEVMVQGPQTEAVAKALAKRGVERRWIEVLDKTKGKKK